MNNDSIQSISKFIVNDKWVYDYGQHFKSVQRLEGTEFSEKEQNYQQLLADRLTAGQETIEGKLKELLDFCQQDLQNTQLLSKLRIVEPNSKHYLQEIKRKKLKFRICKLVDEIVYIHGKLIKNLQ